jgi:hypothetical protein
LKVRAEGVKGDRPADPLELIVRRSGDGDEYREEVILRIGHTELVDPVALQGQIEKALQKLFKSDQP